MENKLSIDFKDTGDFEWVHHEGFYRLEPKKKPNVLLEHISEDDESDTLYSLEFSESGTPGWIIKVKNQEFASDYHGITEFKGEMLEKPIESDGQLILMIPKNYELVRVLQDDFYRLQPKGNWWTNLAPKREPFYVTDQFRPVISVDYGKINVTAHLKGDVQVVAKTVGYPAET